MKKGFMRIIEALLVITLMFTLMTSIVKQQPPTITSTSNMKVLSRWSSDMRNMVCNSPQDNTLIFAGTLDSINASFTYVSPPGLKYRLVVLDASDNYLTETGFVLESTNNMASTGCVLTNGATTRKVVMQTWY